MEEFKSVADMVEYFVVERNKQMNGAILGEIIEIAKENEILTKICLNEKEIIKALREYMEKQNPKTNYDRIKSMSVEEMAEMLIEVTEAPLSGEPFWRTPDGKLFSIWEKTKDEAVEHTIQWLLQEVSEDE